MGEGVAVTEDDEFHPCSCHCHIHATQVGEESYLPVFVASDEGDEDDVAFLSLKAVNGLHRDDITEGFEGRSAAYLLTYVVGLNPVGRNDAHVKTLFEETLPSYLVDIAFEV